jgi:hypothetical protein
MAHLKTTPAALDLNSISVRSISGLSTEDVRELQALGCGSLGRLMGAMERSGGDLRQLSNGHIVIEEAQSKRMGDAVLRYLALNNLAEAWRKKWEPDTSVPQQTVFGDVEVVETTPQQENGSAADLGKWVHRTFFPNW